MENVEKLKKERDEYEAWVFATNDLLRDMWNDGALTGEWKKRAAKIMGVKLTDKYV